MSTIDERVVEMKFNNAQFERGVSTTMRLLESLKRALKLDGAAKGLDTVNAASKRFSLGPMGAAIDGARVKFGALQVAGVAALGTIASKATMAGGQMAKSFTVGPLLDGFREYETKLGSIQTILANTQASGTTLKDVSGTLKELNHYADQTIYNFGEMARNIGTFTAAGVDLKTATGSIKGIANLAALSGSNSQQASTAMYQLSQAISAGKVSLMDWNSVVNAGMGGTVFQRALATTAVNMGKLDEGAVKLTGKMKNVSIEGKAFRESISSENGESWLTSDVLTNTLQQFTGDLSDAELAAQGFSKAQIQAIQDTAKTAKQAATVVKTGTQLVGTLKEAAGSGWAETWEIIIGDFNEAKTLWTGVNDVFGGFIQSSADARNKVLSDWKVLGGRTALIDGIKNAFSALVSVIKPIKDAFREIFPAATGKSLFELTTRFRDFTAGLKIGATTANNLKRTFAGVFAVFSILGQVLGGAIGLIGRFIGSLTGGAGGFLNFTGGIGDFLVSLDKMLKRTGAVGKFFDGLGDLLAKPLSGLQKLGGAILDVFGSFDMPDLSGIGDFFSMLGGWARTAVDTISGAMMEIGSAIVDGFAKMDFSKALAVLNTGLLGGLVLLIRKFVKGGGFNLNIGGGIFDSISEGFGKLTGALQTMQTNVKANIILKIAGALGILAAAILVLSTIDGADMARSLAGISGAFGILAGAMVALNMAIGVMGTLKLPLLAASLIAIAGGMVLMAGAMKLMASLSWTDIGKGLVGIGGSLLVIAGAMKLMPKGMIGQAVAIGLLAVAMSALAGAVKLFGMMDWVTMAKGLLGLAGALLIIAGAMKLMPAGILLQSVALVAVAGALNLIALAMGQMGGMSWEEIGKGLVVLGGSLALLAAGLYLMTAALPGAAAMIVAAGAMLLMTPALMAWGTMDWANIGKAMVVLGGTLLLLAAGLTAMIVALPGAFALKVAAGALAVLTPVLLVLGTMSWESIAKGMVVLAGAFTILGVAGFLLAGLTPVILAVGLAIVMVGAGFALAGVGAMALATAFGILVAAIGAGIGVIKSVLTSLIQAIPLALGALAMGVVKMAQVFAANGPAFTRAMTTIISSILRAVTNSIPRIGALFLTFINTALRVLVTAIPRIANAGLQMITRLLAAISLHVPRIVNIISNLIVRFLNTLASNMGRITTAGGNLIVAFLNGLAKQVPRIAAAATNLIVAFLRAIGQNMPRITAEGTSLAKQFISGVVRGLAGAAGQLAGAAAGVGGNIASGMARGVARGIGSVVSAARTMASNALSAAKNALGVKSPSKEFIKVGKYVVDGFVKGLDGNKAAVHASYKNMRDLLSNAMAAARKDMIDAQSKLQKLAKARHKDVKAIKATRKELALARQEYAKTGRARLTMDKYLRDDRNRIGTLATYYDQYTVRIADANKKLGDAIKTRNDYNQSLRNQLVNVEDITKDTKLPDYISNLEKQILDTQAFATRIQKLRGLGLNDFFYKELLAKGPEALPFVDQLLARGKNGVDQLNTLGSALYKTSVNIGDTASKNLYQAAVDAAAGLVKGLQSQQAKIEREMDRIAGFMVTAIKKKLGIRSPSKVFAELGVWSIEGLAKGLVQASTISEAAAETVGRDAILAMQKTISDMSTAVDSGIDLNPTIRPVLDLSSVQKDASKIGAILPGQSLAVDGAYSSASAASRGYNANQDAYSEAFTPPSEGTNLSFTQINNSPRALSPADVYRNTKNQLSVAKGALKT